MKKLTLLLLLLLPVASLAQERILNTNRTVCDSLATDESHNYTIELEADQFVVGEVHQQNVDAVITIYGPNNKVLGNADMSGRGLENFQFDTEKSGIHRIEVTPFKKENGQYAITVNRVDPIATTLDKRIDQLMTPYSGPNIPGGVIAVIKDGETIFSKGYGMANLIHDIPFTIDKKSNIGSVSKQFTAFGILMLAKQGKLAVDDDIRKYIPELPDFGDTVTLRHLLTHTSGYREILNTIGIAGRDFEGVYISKKEVLSSIQRQPRLQNKPGEEFNYNNSGYMLLAMAIENITGQSLADWMKEHVFDPLGMKDTKMLTNPKLVIPNTVQGYQINDEGQLVEQEVLWVALGASSIYTTAADLTKWIQNLRTGNVGGKDIIKQMSTPVLPIEGAPITADYGLGLMIDEHNGLHRIHHGGSDGGYRAIIMYYPEAESAIIALSNNASFDAFWLPHKVMELLLADQMNNPQQTEDESIATQSEEIRLQPAVLKAFAGKYKIESLNITFNVTTEEGRLVGGPSGQKKSKFTPLSDSTFSVAEAKRHITFHRRDQKEKAETITIEGNNAKTLKGHRIAPWAPSDDDIKVYEGRYFSEELQTFYTIVEKDSSLVVQHIRLDDINLSATEKDHFGSDSWRLRSLVFYRNEDEEVKGFEASNGRTRGVLFKKLDPENQLFSDQ